MQINMFLMCSILESSDRYIVTMMLYIIVVVDVSCEWCDVSDGHVLIDSNDNYLTTSVSGAASI